MKKRIKIAALAMAAVLILPAFEGGSGVGEVKASSVTPASTVLPSGSQSPSPTTSADIPATPQQTPSVNPSGNVPSALPGAAKTKEKSGSAQAHVHSFEYVRIQDATETQDGIIQLQCACGAIGGTITEAGSAAGFFIKDVIKKIENAPENGTVTVDTRIWTCYNQKVMEALQKRPDVTLVTNYCYEHEDYTVTIPAGYDVETLLDENGYCGFRYLDQVMQGNS